MTVDELYAQTKAQPQKPAGRLHEPYTGPFPRCKHTHRCLNCGDGKNCYKAKCTQPQRVERCPWCPTQSR